MYRGGYMDLKIRAVSRELEKISEFIILARKRRHWTQQEMADRLGVTRITIRRLELGPGKVRLELFLNALNLLGLLEGFSEIANPMRDKKAINFELSVINKKQSPSIKNEEVDF